MNPFQRLVLILRLFGHYALDFWRSNFAIARLLLSRRMDLEPRTVTVPIRAREPMETLLLANLITFTPGTLLLNIRPGESCEIHTLTDADEIAESVSERLEKPLLKVTRNA
ncbi:MAG: Na+/H+ antiporter subunit E [Verrucomicrobiota bacterium]